MRQDSAHSSTSNARSGTIMNVICWKIRVEVVEGVSINMFMYSLTTTRSLVASSRIIVYLWR